jgi:hypothetical protein
MFEGDFFIFQERGPVDRYFAPHYAFYVRQMKIKAYAQVMKEDSRENSLNFIVFLVSGVLPQPET